MKKVILLSFIFLFTGIISYSQVNINATVQINGFRHNWDCGNDGVGNEPDPRYRVWIGWNSSTFVQSTAGPGITPGCSDVYGNDELGCSTWNPGVITAATFTNQPMSQINVDMESWDEDACGSNCQANSCGFPSFNSDDTRCGRLRIGDIDFWQQAPCQNNSYNGQFTSGSFLSMHNRCGDNNGAGYGINQLIINWSFASTPTITTQPTSAGADRVLCIGTPTTLSVVVNSWNGWSLGRFYQWQVNTLTTNPTPSSNCPTSGWTNIGGATSSSYIPPQTPGTRLYRCLITSNCTANFSSQTATSECVRVTYQPYAAPIISTACGTTIVPGVPYSFCATLPPTAGASVSNTYTWSVVPAGGVTISNPTASCTNITFTNAGGYTISLTYGDACPAANAVANCVTTVSVPACDMIYVDAATGNNANLGYPNSPVQNLWRAMQLVGGTRNKIRMTGGNYTEPNIIVLQSNVVIEGDWINAGGIWTKSSAQNTNLSFSGEETINGSITQRVGIKATSVTNWALQDLNITTTGVTGTAGDGRGKSNFGVLIDNCTGYTITRCSVTSGNASTGANGGGGGTGHNGGGGGAGQSTGTCNSTSGMAGGGGGSGGSNPWGANGGNGGGGGSTCGNSCGNAGATGTTGGNSGGAGGGGGAATNPGGCSRANGNNGGTGGSYTTTLVNTPGINGGTAGASDTYAGSYTPSGQGSQGGHGRGGGGGGGGSASSGEDGGFISGCIANSGNGGGGGGQGGGGGEGGFGGWGGGSSFAIYRNNSGTTTAPFIDVVLANGTFGQGGFGGNGGNGGNGGGGGDGPNTCSGDRADAGNGGAGGNGARGGNGQNGANGVAGRLYTVGVGFTDPTTSIPNPVTLTIDHDQNGKGCVNSQIDIGRNAAGTWNLPSATYINDQNMSTSSYNNSVNNVSVYYTANGTYAATTNGSTYNGEIRIIDNTRPVPVLSVTSSPVCTGNSFSLSATSWGSELAWEWIIFTNNATVPGDIVASSTVANPTFNLNVTSITTYNIRYRVRENCCGWSRPVYTTVTINPAATVAAGSDNYVCEGTAFPLLGASATNFSSVGWTTAGDGSFSNSGIVSPTYTPGPNDALNGSVILTLTNTALGGCIGNNDQVTLTVRRTGEWLGVQNTPANDNWNNAANWCGGIPTMTTNALIPTTPQGAFWPIIGANDAVVQDLTLQNLTTLTYYQNNSLDVYRDFYNYGATINTNQGLTRFTGNAYNGNIGGTSATDFYNMAVNKTGGTQMNISANQRVYNNLDMVSGDINVQSPSYLELGTNALSPGTLTWNSTNQPTIMGWFRRWYGASTNSGNTTGLFPVGNVQSSAIYNRWMLLEYTSAPAAGGYLTTRFVGSPAPFYTGLPLIDAGQLLQNFANEGYWEVNPGGGITGGSYRLTLRANTFTTVNTLSAVRIIKSFDPHVVWALDGSHGTTSGTLTDFTISRNGMSNFSWFTIAADNANPLPVELADLHATCTHGKVTLHWATASEENNEYFAVERSTDGVNWEEIARINGAGNSNTLLTYSHTDEESIPGLSYYRLTQVDYDGKRETFGPVSIACLLQGENSLRMYPNPARQEINIAVTLDKEYGTGIIRISDMLGRVVMERIVNLQQGENQYLVYGLQTLTPGAYHVSLVADNLNFTIQKLIIQR